MLELKQLVGRRREPGGKLIEVAYPVDTIIIDGRRRGYIDHKRHAHIVLTEFADDITKAKILAEISSHEHRTSTYGAPSGVVTCPPSEISIREIESDDEIESEEE